MSIPHWLWIPLGALGFGAWCCFICWGLAFVSGWAKLAGHFRATGAPLGQLLYLQSGQLNSTRYNNVLIISVTPQGLYLKVFPLFRIGHPPLLIPWSALSPFKTSKQMWVTLHTTTVTLGKFNKVTIAFYDPKIVAAISAYLPSAGASP